MKSFLNIFLHRILAILQYLERAFPQKTHLYYYYFNQYTISEKILIAFDFKIYKTITGIFPKIVNRRQLFSQIHINNHYEIFQ